MVLGQNHKSIIFFGELFLDNDLGKAHGRGAVLVFGVEVGPAEGQGLGAPAPPVKAAAVDRGEAVLVPLVGVQAEAEQLSHPFPLVTG